MSTNEEKPKCSLCGEPMPEGEEMFMFHGYSGPCPKEPLQVTAAKEGVPEFGWLIEKMIGGTCHYFAHECGQGAWSVSWENAFRFARKCDAEAMVKTIRGLRPDFMDDTVYVSEHQWG